ncbi:hypothetical protein CesoFtcFv8_020509 [Champsocephalus esox]|uniref:Uncharacterized protein n=1 Tax=Champsocephalus esox TaxID=159716 RepID=A0AAN8BBY5_9TELE|nr:hypothetical protein CesoFtcFv8_020509 [Champsocephalus esox]
MAPIKFSSFSTEHGTYILRPPLTAAVSGCVNECIRVGDAGSKGLLQAAARLTGAQLPASRLGLVYMEASVV